MHTDKRRLELIFTDFFLGLKKLGSSEYGVRSKEKGVRRREKGEGVFSWNRLTEVNKLNLKKG